VRPRFHRDTLLVAGLPIALGALAIAGSLGGWGFPERVLWLLAVPGHRLGTGVRIVVDHGGLGLILALIAASVACGWITLRRPWRSPRLELLLLLVSSCVLALGARLFVVQGAAPAVLLLWATSLAIGPLVAMRALVPGPQAGDHSSDPGPWLSALALSWCAVLFLGGVDRETGSRFLSQWQCWSCLTELGWQPQELLRLTTGTTRCSMESGPYRWLVLASFGLFDASWTVLRALSGISMLVAAFALHGWLRSRLSGWAAVSGTALFGTAPLVVDWAHVPSFVGPSVLLTVLTTIGYDRWITSGGKRGSVPLGLLLLLCWYGFAPLRFMIAFLPVAVLLAWREARTGPRVRRLVPVVAPLLVPLVLAVAATRFDPVTLFYADGEFVPTQGFESDARFHGNEPLPLREVPFLALRLLLNTFGGWPHGEYTDDGVVLPTTALHVLAVLLGLLSLAVRGLWPRRTRALLIALMLCLFPAMISMAPALPRRMVVWLPLLLIVGAGSFELVRRCAVATWQPSVPLQRGAAAAIIIALGCAAAIGYPGLSTPRTGAAAVTDPLSQTRSLADDALARGYRMLLVGPTLRGMPPSEWTTGRVGVLEGSWGFYHWRDCEYRHGRGDVGMVPSDGPLSADVLHAAIAGYELGVVGVESPLFWIEDASRRGDEQRLLFVDPDRAAGQTVLDLLQRSNGVVWCDRR